MARRRTQAQADAEARYEKAKKAAGEFVQINVRLKTAADIKMIEKLRGRFEGMKDTEIARLALRELAGKGNRK